MTKIFSKPFKRKFFTIFTFILKSSETYAEKNLAIGSFWGGGGLTKENPIIPNWIE